MSTSDDGGPVSGQGSMPRSTMAPEVRFTDEQRAALDSLGVPVPLHATKESARFGDGWRTGLDVETYAPDERETWARDHVTFRAESEAGVGTVDLDADEVAQVQAILGGWLAARGLPTRLPDTHA